VKSEYRRLAHVLNPEVTALAIKIADATTCDLLRNEGGYPDGDKWLDVEVMDAIDDELKYAAMRGFIERRPEQRTQFRFTAAGVAVLAVEEVPAPKTLNVKGGSQ
jgi:hypothetical protein